MEEYRNSLAASFVFRFFVDLAQRVQKRVPGFVSPLPQEYEGAASRYHRPPASGLQYYSKTDDGSVIGQPYRHMSADVQVQYALWCTCECSTALAQASWEGLHGIRFICSGKLGL